MNHNRWLLACVFVPTAAAMAQTPANFSAIQLTPPPGWKFGPVDLSNHGVVAGVAYAPGSNSARAAWWTVHSFTVLPTLGSSAHAVAINSSGFTVGYSWLYSGQGAPCHSALWTPSGTVYDLGVLWGSVSMPGGISASGLVTGRSYTQQNPERESAFLWSPGIGMTNLGDGGGGRAWGIAVNDHGTVVGERVRREWYASQTSPSSRAWIWDAQNGMRDLPFDPDRHFDVRAINNAGQVVGDFNPGMPFLWQPEGGIMVLTPARGKVFDINERGIVVGGGSIDGAFTWDSIHGARKINDRLGTPIVADMPEARAINDRGQILLRASNFPGNPAPTTFWLLTPCPADCNDDGVLTIDDLVCFQARFAASDLRADCNTDEYFTVADFGCFQTAFVTGCP